MGLQIIQKALQPGITALRIRPDFYVFVDAGKDGAAQFEFWIDSMQCGGPLQVERRVIFRQHELPVGFLAHFHIRNGIAALFEVGQLGGAVFRRRVDHGNGNHRRQMIGDAAAEERDRNPFEFASE